MAYWIVGQHTAPKGNILLDAEVQRVCCSSADDYPENMRLVVAEVEVDGRSGPRC